MTSVTQSAGKECGAEIEPPAPGLQKPPNGPWGAVPALQFWLVLFCALSHGFFPLLGSTSWAQDSKSDLAEVDIEQLMNMEVTSVSGKARKVSHTASAIYVITAEDIRRSGATSIPEALRLAPGLQVFQINDNVWAVSSRGFAYRYANKLQVLVDGRSLYTTALGGVDWNVHNMLLEDVERIEVIRGPGASLWGGNAFNGVINIITRHSRDTQGALLTTAVGSHERVHSSLRYGGKLASNATYRFGAQFLKRDGSLQVSGDPARDGGDVLQGGARVDWDPSPANEFTFTGSLEDRDTDNLAANFLGRPLLPPVVFDRLQWRTGSIMGRWQHFFPQSHDFSLQWSYDWLARQDPNVDDDRHTTSVDFRHHVSVGSRQDWLWGLGYNRFQLGSQGNADFSFADREDGAAQTDLEPYKSHDADSRYVLFAQNEIAVAPERFFLIPGARVQYETDSRWGVQPNLRALWIVNSRHSIWGSVSRALRTLTELEDHAHITVASLGEQNSIPAFLTLDGNEDFRSERLLAYELGYRGELRRGISLDIATFFNSYHDLRTREPGTPFFTTAFPFPRVEVPLQFDNKMDGETYGVELAASWQVNHRWTLQGTYSRLEIQLHPHADSRDPQAELDEGASPKHQFNLRSRLQLGPNLELDTELYYVSSLPNLSIASYTRVDSQITWRLQEKTALTIGGQNLLRPQHPEFPRLFDPTLAGQAERNIFGKLVWRF